MKFGLFALMLIASWLMYDNRAFVGDAYATSDTEVDIRLTGIDLDVEKTPLPPSPFMIRGGSDTRRRPLELAYVEASGDESESAVAMDGGTSTLTGTATVDSRPAAGATVRIERHTAAGVGSLTVFADRAGQWAAGDLPGGRYRIRSWLADQAVDRAGTVFFLEAGSVKSHAFRMEEIDERPAAQMNNSGVMFDGLTGSIGVTVGSRQVDLDGRVVTGPLKGARVTLQVSGAAKIESPRTVAVNELGHATFKLRCTGVGSVNVSAEISLPGTGAPTVARSPGEDSESVPVKEDIIRVRGRHPGCRAIPPPPPPTTAAPTDNDKKPAGGASGRSPGQNTSGGDTSVTGGGGDTSSNTTTPTTTRSAAGGGDSTESQQADARQVGEGSSG